jgi:integrase
MRANPTNANRVLQLIKAFFFWLDRQDLFHGDNPAKRTERYPERARERFLTVEEMGRLGEALRVAESQGLDPAPQHRKPRSEKRVRNNGMFVSAPQMANPTAVAALRLLMFTGWREREALSLRWDAVDLARGTVTLEDTKSGRSIRPVPAPALALIAAQSRLSGSDFVFPGRIDGKPLREIQRLWYAVRHSAELDGVRLHDLRHSVASVAATQGYSLFLISKLLGHKDLRSTARYAHLAEDARKAMADSVGDHILVAIDGLQGGASRPQASATSGSLFHNPKARSAVKG